MEKIGNKRKVIYTTWYGSKGSWIEPQHTIGMNQWDLVFFVDENHYSYLKHQKSKWNIVKDNIPKGLDLDIEQNRLEIHNQQQLKNYIYTIYIASDTYIIDCNPDELINLLDKGSYCAYTYDFSFIIRLHNSNIDNSMKRWLNYFGKEKTLYDSFTRAMKKNKITTNRIKYNNSHLTNGIRYLSNLSKIKKEDK